ncbi:MAG: hypothetical protein Q9160_008113 [Pyrenula sp. 1 TL-2023]
MADKVKTTAVEESQRVKELTQQAIKSEAYLYPFKGIIYFISHRSLWKPLFSKLAPTLSLGLVVTIFMFIFAYLPQAAVLAFTSGPLAAVSAALLTLSESSTIVNMLSRAFLIEEALIDTFDGALLARGCTNLVADGRQLKPGSDPIGRLGRLLKKPFARFTPKALIRYLLYLPLNFIPVVGTILFVILQGKRNGPTAHARYFQLKEYNKTQRDEHVERNRAAYTSFGVAAFLLEMVPVVSLAFSFTNTVGAALWAADIETQRTTAPSLREQAKKAE